MHAQRKLAANCLRDDSLPTNGRAAARQKQRRVAKKQLLYFVEFLFSGAAAAVVAATASNCLRASRLYTRLISRFGCLIFSPSFFLPPPNQLAAKTQLQLQSKKLLRFAQIRSPRNFASSSCSRQAAPPASLFVLLVHLSRQLLRLSSLFWRRLRQLYLLYAKLKRSSSKLKRRVSNTICGFN